MKTTIIALVYILTVKIAFGQQDLLSFDEHNKYIYYQVADMPGLTADTIRARAEQFLKADYPKIAVKPISARDGISGEGKLITHAGVSLLNHPNGEVDYVLNIEFKDQKYRFWLTDFVFTPYQRDRYGNFVPRQGIDIPMENALSRFEKKQVDDCLTETGTFCKQFGDKLKQFLTNAPKKEEVTKKVVTDKW